MRKIAYMMIYAIIETRFKHAGICPSTLAYAESKKSYKYDLIFQRMPTYKIFVAHTLNTREVG